ncbi:lamin tail domain-containing protein [Chryseobacterium indoltheticum]|uniref:lamin tail domain-containing protein n=1 Tax=Chryseobacterium indoltheticum TaxID=254 RepID=UPI003F495C42
MKMKVVISFLLFVSCNTLHSQIAVTEVYVNTPFNEKLRFGNDTNGFVDANKHHRGEFVEIYNYSDKDINLQNWYMKDRQNTIRLPDKIIKSGQFMIIAYSSMPYHTTVFKEYFPSTAGKDNQIIYQDDILLRNKYDQIVIGYGIGYKGIDKSGFTWEWGAEPAPNFIPNLHSNTAGFYTVKSIQYHPDPYSTMDPNVQLGNRDIYNYTSTPNPLAADYVPPMQSYDELMKNDMQEYYSFLDWTDNVNYLIDKQCLINIEKVSQTPAGSYSGNGSGCFSYDEAGNMIA